MSETAGTAREHSEDVPNIEVDLQVCTPEDLESFVSNRGFSRQPTMILLTAKNC